MIDQVRGEVHCPRKDNHQMTDDDRGDIVTEIGHVRADPHAHYVPISDQGDQVL